MIWSRFKNTELLETACRDGFNPILVPDVCVTILVGLHSCEITSGRETEWIRNAHHK